MWKGEIARNQQFLLLPQCFLPVWITLCHFSWKLKLSSANSFSLEESKICCLVMVELFTKRQKFRLVWIQSTRRQQNKCDQKKKKCKFLLGMVENNLGKGENAGKQHFLLFPKCFQKTYFSGSLIVGIVLKKLTHYHTMLHFDALKIYSCGKHCEKKRNCL